MSNKTGGPIEGKDKSLVDQSFPLTDPIFWGPNQDTQYPDNYNEPEGFKRGELLAIPEVIRLVYGNAGTGSPPPPPPPPPPTEWCFENTGDKSFHLIGYRWAWDGIAIITNSAEPPLYIIGSHYGCTGGGQQIGIREMKQTVIVDNGPYYLGDLVTTKTGQELLDAIIRTEEHRRIASQGWHNKNRAGLKPPEPHPLFCSFPLPGGFEPQNIPTVVADNTSMYPDVPPLSGSYEPGPGAPIPGPSTQNFYAYEPPSNKFTFFYFFRCRTTGYEPIGFATQLSTYIWTRGEAGWITTPTMDIP